MRRYRFGRIAALLAAAYVAVVAAFGVVALITGDPALLRTLVVEEWSGPRDLRFIWWVELIVVALGTLQGWAFWQVLRGRAAGEVTNRDWRAGLLRTALYANVAHSLLLRIPVQNSWWMELFDCLVQLAVVWLYFPVFARALPLGWRLFALVAGSLSAITGIAYLWDLIPLVRLGGLTPLDELTWALWLVTVLAGQARDPRWSQATVRIGAFWATLWFLSPSSYSYVTYFGGVDHAQVLHMTMGALMIFGTVWDRRSCRAGPDRGRPRDSPPVARHDLGSLPGRRGRCGLRAHV